MPRPPTAPAQNSYDGPVAAGRLEDDEVGVLGACGAQLDGIQEVAGLTQEERATFARRSVPALTLLERGETAASSSQDGAHVLSRARPGWCGPSRVRWQRAATAVPGSSIG